MKKWWCTLDIKNNHFGGQKTVMPEKVEKTKKPPKLDES